MLIASIWVLGGAVAGGLGLSCFYLMERPIRGAARVGSWVHGGLGASGVALLAAVMLAGPGDASGFGGIALGALGFALLGGLAVLGMQWRRRRPAGLLVAVHATVAVAGYVMLLAYMSLPTSP